jgi:ABC-type Fe3+-hydroxamate transport system substrate-binding protein
VDQVRDTIRAVAERLGVPERGEALVREMDVQIAAVAERLAGLEPRRTLLLIGREPGGWQSLFVAGPGSFVSELAEHAGAVNALGGETLGAYPTISREIIIATDPEVILDTVFEYTGSTPEQREAERALYRESLPTVTAVRDGRVILWDDPHLTVPGPGMAAQIEKLARAIHPEAFDD